MTREESKEKVRTCIANIRKIADNEEATFNAKFGRPGSRMLSDGKIASLRALATAIEELLSLHE